MIMLGSCKQFVMYPPVGDSNARWVSKFLYGAKKYKYKSQLKLDPQTITNLKDFLVFMVYVYLPGWYMASFLSESTASDLQLAKDLEWYKNVNQSEAARVLLNFKTTAGILVPNQPGPFCFWAKCRKVEKQQLAAKILGMESKWESRGIKLKGDHSLFTQRDYYVGVSQLDPLLMVDERSKAVMEFQDIPSNWLTSDEFEQSLNRVNQISCVNNACERAVQMADSFNLKGPKAEDARQDFYWTLKSAREQPVSSLAALQDYCM